MRSTVIVRAPRPEANFTQIRNATLRNSDLSFRARGLLGYILSMPDNWESNSEALARQGTEGRDAVRTALRELEGAGHLRRTRRRIDGGRFETVTTIYDEPQVAPETDSQAPDEPASADQSSEHQASVSQALSKTLPNNTVEQQVDMSTDPKAAQVQEVFAAWVAATGKNAGTKLSADRRRKVLARLNEGYPVEDLVAAARGVALSAFHMGDNDSRKPYNDLELVMRSGSKVEHFRDLYLAGGEPDRRRSESPVDAMQEALAGFAQAGRAPGTTFGPAAELGA